MPRICAAPAANIGTAALRTSAQTATHKAKRDDEDRRDMKVIVPAGLGDASEGTPFGQGEDIYPEPSTWRSARLLDPGAAPALGSDLLAGEKGAQAGRVSRLSLEQLARGAGLRGLVLGVFLAVHFRRVLLVAECDGLRVAFFQLRPGRLGAGLRDRKHRTRGRDPEHEDSTIGAFHGVTLWDVEDRKSVV